MNQSRATLLMTALVAALIAVAVFVMARTLTAVTGDVTDAAHRPRVGYSCPRVPASQPVDCTRTIINRGTTVPLCPRQNVDAVHCTLVTVYPR